LAKIYISQVVILIAALGYVDVGQGLPIILVHGLFIDLTAFETQLQAFADRYRIIAIDIHGHGASSELDRVPSLECDTKNSASQIVLSSE
jgi:pimeloyl-ACP methyl ester carboxylesterase